jgi:hypothetical protein
MKRKLSQKSQSTVRLWRSNAKRIIENLQEKNAFANFGDSSISLTPSESIRVVSETIKECPIRNLLLKCMLDAETKSPGSSIVMLNEISGRHFDADIVGKRFTMNDVKHSLDVLIGEPASSIVIDAITLAGRQGKIFVDSSISQHTEISYGTQSCRWRPEPSFFAASHMSKISVQNCKVLFVDGIIESVSEIHKVFNESYEKKIPVVIFARGYAEEVVATSAINLQRQTAQIVPVVIPFDEVGVNGMADLASCFSSEVISSDKGQLISNVGIEECKSVDRVTVTPSMTEIEFKENAVDKVVSRLSTRLREADVGQSELIRRRIEALGTGSVSIRIGNDKKSIAGIIKDRVDFGIRFSKSCITYGVIQHLGIKFPARSVDSGIDCAKSFISILDNCGGILEVDKCG